MQGVPPGRIPHPTLGFVGPNYQKYGEVEGYRYDPYSDTYKKDPKHLQTIGLLPKDPEQPSLTDQVLPIAAGLTAAGAAKELGPMLITGGKEVLGGLLSGSGAATGTTVADTLGTGLASTAAENAAFNAGATQAGGGLGGGGLLSAGSLVPGAAVAAGLLAGGKGVKDLLAGKSGTDSWEGLAGRGTLGIATGGLSELARLTGLLGHKSTKDYQKERLEKLRATDPGAAAFLETARQTADANNDTWQDGKYAGEKWSFDKAVDLAKDDPTHFIGTLGNMETFGDQWLGVDEEKQKAVVAELLNQGLYNSDKGDVLISDQSRAREIFDEIMGNNAVDTGVV